jgi:hypothetical protein
MTSVPSLEEGSGKEDVRSREQMCEIAQCQSGLHRSLWDHSIRYEKKSGKVNSDEALWPIPIRNLTSETYESIFWTLSRRGD